jgi:hypothetical protein
MDSEHRRKIVELFVKDITIGKEEVSINLYYLTTSEEMTIRQRTL